MSLVTRIGASNANSFVRLDQANYIIGQLPDEAGDWLGLTDQEKEYRLVLATKIIGLLPLRGLRVYRDQALAFPRTIWLKDDDEWRAEENSRRIPDEVREAQCQIAYSVVHRALANRPDVTEEVTSSVKSVSLGGSLSVTFNGSKAAGSGNLLDRVMSSLQVPVYLKMQRHLSVFRGRVIRNVVRDAEEDDPRLWTEEEMLPSTTTTTSTSSTTLSSTSSHSTTTTTA